MRYMYLDISIAHSLNYTCTVMYISAKSHWKCLLIAMDWLVTVYHWNFFLEYLKPIAAREREVEAERAQEKAELEAIKKAEAAKGLSTCMCTRNSVDQNKFHQGHYNLSLP